MSRNPTGGDLVFHALLIPGLDVEHQVAVRISGSGAAIHDAEQGLTIGAARPEAVAARLERANGEVRWGEPASILDRRALVRLCWERGESSVEITRADPTLLPALQVGSFFSTSVRRRLARRLLLFAPGSVLSRLPAALAADVAFWRGVRSRATRREWDRLTRSSYVVVYYHRVAGERKPAQQRRDVAPARFERQIKWLRRLGMRVVSAEDLIAFHANVEATLPRRTIVLAADDGFRDAVLALGRHADLRPYLFVPSAAVGGSATWMDDEPVASWAELSQVASRGAEIGSHTRTHPLLPGLDSELLVEELEQSLRELRARIPHARAMLAYPHGRSDEKVRAAAAAVGYDVAFSTEPGRNGAGTDPYRLRRVELKDWDGPVAVAWKALTGELFPWSLERWKFRFFAWRRARQYREIARRGRVRSP
jgi:peptidoglycan/xylan/chitin deacetylase (PgdA/CDA1 family)